jgi:hypothetical protein
MDNAKNQHVTTRLVYRGDLISLGVEFIGLPIPSANQRFLVQV